MRKTLGLLAVLGLLNVALLILAPPAHAQSICELGISTGTTFVPCDVTTSGTDNTTTGDLYDIEIDTGAAGNFVVCFDSNSITNLALTNSTNEGTWRANRRMKILTVTATNTFTRLPTGTLPEPYTRGLMCAKSAEGFRARVIYSRRSR